MQQPQQRVECRGQHRGGVREPFGKLRLGQFDVPVTEFVPREVVERLAGPAELVAVEGRIDLGANLFQPSQNPPVGVGQLGFRQVAAPARAPLSNANRVALNSLVPKLRDART